MARIEDYITTENYEQGRTHRGRVQITDSYQSEDSHLAFCDLEVQTVDGLTIDLHRIDLDKLYWLCDNAIKQVRVVSPDESRELFQRDRT